MPPTHVFEAANRDVDARGKPAQGLLAGLRDIVTRKFFGWGRTWF